MRTTSLRHYAEERDYRCDRWPGEPDRPKLSLLLLADVARTDCIEM